MPIRLFIILFIAIISPIESPSAETQKSDFVIDVDYFLLNKFKEDLGRDLTPKDQTFFELYKAASHGDIGAAKNAIQNGANINEIYEDHSALLRAAETANLSFLDWVFAAYPKISEEHAPYFDEIFIAYPEMSDSPLVNRSQSYENMKVTLNNDVKKRLKFIALNRTLEKTEDADRQKFCEGDWMKIPTTCAAYNLGRVLESYGLPEWSVWIVFAGYCVVCLLIFSLLFRIVYDAFRHRST